MAKRMYEKPTTEMLELETADVILTSGDSTSSDPYIYGTHNPAGLENHYDEYGNYIGSW